MLRSSLIVAVVACIVAAYAPSLFPSLFQAMNGSGGPAAPQPAPAVGPSPPVQASASRDESDRIAEIYADRGGQYSTDVVVNGVIVHMMIDTGATFVALSAETASRLGLALGPASYTGRVRTANGIASVAPVTLTSVSVGDIFVPAVQGLVMEPQAGHDNLLGMSFLKRLSAVEQKSGRLILRQ
jgi:aspartyl protease family protein